MEQKTRYICKCGAWAEVEDRCTGVWFCLRCGLDEMIKVRRRGDTVTITLSGIATDVLLIPDDDVHEPDLLAPLVDVVAISFCRN